MIFTEIAKAKIKEDDFLWRYLDLHKLIDFAITQELHFTRTDTFPDPFEGVTYKLIADRYFAQKSNMTNPEIPAETRRQYNGRNKAILANYPKESLERQKTQFINCWIRCQRESIAMWNLYSNRDSVAIRINARQLIDYFKNSLQLQPLFYPKYHFVCGSISYLKLNPLDAFEKPKLPKYSSFKKDVAYDFEKEFRLLIATPLNKADSNPSFFRLPLTTNFLELLDIICHPEMETWKFDNLTKLCASYMLPIPSRSRTELRPKF